MSDRPATDITAGLQALRAPFPPAAIGKLPRGTCSMCSKAPNKRCESHQWVSRCQVCGNSHTSATIHIDYVGHADVTDRLLQVDPEWTWTFTSKDPNTGFPLLDANGGLWIDLTVLGVTRHGYGDPGKNKGRPEGMKEAIGDALRNAAMRFGVALDLWTKGDREWASAEKVGAEDSHPDASQPRQSEPSKEWTGPSTARILSEIDEAAQAAGVTYAQAVAKFCTSKGIDADALEGVAPWHLIGLRDAVQKRAREVVAERAAAEAAAAAARTDDALPAADAATEDPPGFDGPAPEATGPDPWATPTS